MHGHELFNIESTFLSSVFSGQTKVNMAVYVSESYLFNSFTVKTPSVFNTSIEVLKVQGRSSQ